MRNMAFTDKILSPLLSPLKRALKDGSGVLPVRLKKPLQTFADFFERGSRSQPPAGPVVPGPVVLPKSEQAAKVAVAPAAPAAPTVKTPDPITIPKVPETFADLAATPGALKPSAEAKPEPAPPPMPKGQAPKIKPSAKAAAANATANGKAEAVDTTAPASATKQAAPAKKKPAAAKKAKAGANAAEAKPLDWPLLGAAAKSKKLVLAGGIPKKPIQAWLESAIGAPVHWTDTSGSGTRSVAGLELAIQRDGVSAVVLLEGSISHAESERVIAACKKAKVPLARGKRGGRQSLKDALTTLEKAFAKSAN